MNHDTDRHLTHPVQSTTRGNMTADLNFTVTAGGGGANPAAGVDNFVVNDSAGGFFVTWPNANYYVAASLAGVAAIFGVDIVSQTVHGFTVQLTAPLVSGDTIRFHVFDAANTTFPPSEDIGRHLARQVFTTSGTYTPTTGANRVLVRMSAGGGGGGGAAGAATGGAVGGGGASGIYFEAWIDPSAAITGGTVTIGAGGAGGLSTGAAGSTGGDTSVVVNTTTYTTKGGFGGSGMTNKTAAALSAGGFPVTGSSTGDVVFGNTGGDGVYLGGAVGYAGLAGCNPFGGAANTRTLGVPGIGNTGMGFGSGGGGASATTASKAGGAGLGGIVIIDEYT